MIAGIEYFGLEACRRILVALRTWSLSWGHSVCPEDLVVVCRCGLRYYFVLTTSIKGPTLIKVKSVKSDFNRRAAADFEAAFLRRQQSGRELQQGEPPSRGRAIRRCRKQGVPPMMGPHNERASSGPGASHRENFRGPTLILIKVN